MGEDNILATVLAGGKSQRFGKNKSEVLLNKKKLIDHTLEKLDKKFNKIIIVSNDNNQKDYTTIKDCLDGQLGPLVGVLSAMKWATENYPKKYKWVMTFPCDTPFFSSNIIDRFISEANANDSQLYFAKVENKRHNIFGLWSIELMERLEKDLVVNMVRKVEKWANSIGLKNIEFKSSDADNFYNINTQEDLIHAENMIKEKQK